MPRRDLHPVGRGPPFHPTAYYACLITDAFPEHDSMNIHINDLLCLFCLCALAFVPILLTILTIMVSSRHGHSCQRPFVARTRLVDMLTFNGGGSMMTLSSPFSSFSRVNNELT